MENKFTTEQMRKAANVKNVEELIKFAKDEGVELSEAQAKAYLAQLNPTNSAISDEELEAVAGGCDSELRVEGYVSASLWGRKN